MERGSRLFLFLALFGALYFFFGTTGDKVSEAAAVPGVQLKRPEGKRPTPEQCDIWTEYVRTRISTAGGSLISHEPLTAKYRKHNKALELVTTPTHAELSPLYTNFRSAADIRGEKEWLVQTDIQDFTITESSAQSCTLTFENDRVRIVKTFSAGSSPYTLDLTTSVTNLDKATHPYAFSVEMGSYLLDDKVQSKMFRMNPLMTHVECFSKDGEITRERVEDFSPDDFDDRERFRQNSINSGVWSQPTGKATLAAVSNAYFSGAIAHDEGPASPVCLLQIDERWNRAKWASNDDDPLSGAIYQARLAYESRDLKAGATETYRFKAFIGPKERQSLSDAGARFEPLIDLGFFSYIAEVLVTYLMWLYQIVPSWGWAIILLTITAKALLFPLTWPSVKNMIHMRELKPEMDKLTEQYKDDPQAKGLAQMQLWKKHGVNPMKGCLPQLISMPVWFALYTTLQTAVELYNIPFLWFPDLSESDPYYILPFVIGVVFFAQQKLMPMQGDPAQQKMMMYFMPGMFTVFMLFLPAGLGVYMFTNSLLGIAQQQWIERHTKKSIQARRNQVEVTQTPPAPKKKKNKRS